MAPLFLLILVFLILNLQPVWWFPVVSNEQSVISSPTLSPVPPPDADQPDPVPEVHGVVDLKHDGDPAPEERKAAINNSLPEREAEPLGDLADPVIPPMAHFCAHFRVTSGPPGLVCVAPFLWNTRQLVAPLILLII